MRFLLSMFLGVGLVLTIAPTAFSHCEVPCGIYDDEVRVKLIHEHATTVAKAMMKIKELSAEGEKNYNQLIRWINNKEEHAKKIQDIAHQYFMTQRIKPKGAEDGDAYVKYVRELTLMHQIMVHAMKAKQTTDITHTTKIDELTHEFSTSYFGGQMKGSDKGSKGSMKGSRK